MSENLSFTIDENTLQKMIKMKEEMGFGKKDWQSWFEAFFNEEEEETSVNQTIERIFQKTTTQRYYDNWVRNFALNIENIWKGRSAKELSEISSKDKVNSPAIVIGRGPSLEKNNHLELLANSNYKGAIICTDGILKKALDSGVTPEKFPNFYVVTIDTNEPILKFYSHDIVKKYGKKIKCLLSTTVPPTTYDAIKNSGMEIFWLHTLFDYNKGKTSFNYIAGIITRAKNHEKGLSAIQTGGNVGTSSWVISWSILKCSPVALIGIDHGYPDDMSWEEIDKIHKLPEGIDKTSPMFKKAYPIVYNPEFKTNCKQDPIFQYYSNALKEFIPRALKWVKTVNATEGGAIFGEGIECMTFKNFLKKFN